MTAVLGKDNLFYVIVSLLGTYPAIGSEQGRTALMISAGIDSEFASGIAMTGSQRDFLVRLVQAIAERDFDNLVRSGRPRCELGLVIEAAKGTRPFLLRD